MSTDKDFKEINFENVGGMNQYEVDLFKIGERPFDIKRSMTSKSFVDFQLEHIQKEVTLYLKNEGFENPRGKFKSIHGNIARCETTDLLARTLHEAIQDRDRITGQSGIYLAAYIEYWCWRLAIEWEKESWKNPDAIGWILDIVMLVQHYFFTLVLYTYQPFVSCGRKSLKSAHEKSKKPRPGGRKKHIDTIKLTMRSSKKEEVPFKVFLANAENGAIKNLIITNDGEKYQVLHDDNDGPPLSVSEGTIRSWYRTCCDEKSQK